MDCLDAGSFWTLLLLSGAGESTSATAFRLRDVAASLVWLACGWSILTMTLCDVSQAPQSWQGQGHRVTKQTSTTRAQHHSCWTGGPARASASLTEAVERFKAERRDGRERSVGGSAIGLLLKGLLEAATVAETFAVATLAAVLAFRLLAFLLPAVFVGYTSSLSSQSSSSSSISALASFGPRLGRLGRLGSTRRAE